MPLDGIRLFIYQIKKMVPERGVEPLRPLKSADFKSAVSAIPPFRPVLSLSVNNDKEDKTTKTIDTISQVAIKSQAQKRVNIAPLALGGRLCLRFKGLRYKKLN